ncbi:MAG TPA: SPFH domain-containing protein [Syntrophales bacterium]|nr:SPFH domain-containing protein [Syntrophales bacterium]
MPQAGPVPADNTAMGANNLIFLEVIEWFDESGSEIIHRIPESGSGEIKFGAQLIVRESQAAVFFYKGKGYDAFGPGRHTLITSNIPILTKIASLPWGMTSPLRAEVWFANMKEFPNLKWGTRDPVAFRDKELGLIRLRAFGIFGIRVVQPLLFINKLVGTQGIFTTAGIEEYLGQIIVSRFNDMMGEGLDTVFNLPGKYEAISAGLLKKVQEDLSRYGIALSSLYTGSITPPPEVQKAIDDKSRLGVFDDLDKLIKMKAAMALEKASEPGGETSAGAGIGMGLGLLVPAMLAGMVRPQDGKGAPGGAHCPECGAQVPEDSRFCSRCGHQILVFGKCQGCGKNVPPQANFCPRCGRSVSAAPGPEKCPHCGKENLPESSCCNNCGNKI